MITIKVYDTQSLDGQDISRVEINQSYNLEVSTKLRGLAFKYNTVRKTYYKAFKRSKQDAKVMAELIKWCIEKHDRHLLEQYTMKKRKSNIDLSLLQMGVEL